MFYKNGSETSKKKCVWKNVRFIVTIYFTGKQDSDMKEKKTKQKN